MTSPAIILLFLLEYQLISKWIISPLKQHISWLKL